MSVNATLANISTTATRIPKLRAPVIIRYDGRESTFNLLGTTIGIALGLELVGLLLYTGGFPDISSHLNTLLYFKRRRKKRSQVVQKDLEYQEEFQFLQSTILKVSTIGNNMKKIKKMFFWS